jgi:HK97 gp10 family phage protein
MSFGVTVDISRAVSMLNRIGSGVQSVVVAPALKAGTDAGVQAAQAGAPVKTGYLRSPIRPSAASGTSLSYTANASYSLFQEEGTSRVSGKHFMKNSISIAQQTALTTAQQALQGLIR